MVNASSLGTLRPFVYVAGPITGRKNMNKAAFSRAMRGIHRVLTRWSVVVPHDLYRPSGAARLCPGLSWCEAMAALLPIVERADLVYMLTGWETSRGASREYAHALSRGIPILIEPSMNGGT
jgi:hypothetical protein